jgi:hypothetical protein
VLEKPGPERQRRLFTGLFQQALWVPANTGHYWSAVSPSVSGTPHDVGGLPNTAKKCLSFAPLL